MFRVNFKITDKQLKVLEARCAKIKGWNNRPFRVPPTAGIDLGIKGFCTVDLGDFGSIEMTLDDVTVVSIALDDEMLSRPVDDRSILNFMATNKVEKEWDASTADDMKSLLGRVDLPFDTKTERRAHYARLAGYNLVEGDGASVDASAIHTACGCFTGAAVPPKNIHFTTCNRLIEGDTVKWWQFTPLKTDAEHRANADPHVSAMFEADILLVNANEFGMDMGDFTGSKLSGGDCVLVVRQIAHGMHGHDTVIGYGDCIVVNAEVLLSCGIQRKEWMNENDREAAFERKRESIACHVDESRTKYLAAMKPEYLGERWPHGEGVMDKIQNLMRDRLARASSHEFVPARNIAPGDVVRFDMGSGTGEARFQQAEVIVKSDTGPKSTHTCTLNVVRENGTGETVTKKCVDVLANCYRKRVDDESAREKSLKKTAGHARKSGRAAGHAPAAQ